MGVWIGTHGFHVDASDVAAAASVFSKAKTFSPPRHPLARNSAVAFDAAKAIAVARDQIRTDPQFAHDYGCALIFKLVDEREFSAAVDFALSAAGEEKSSWLDIAFDLWAAQAPHDAMRAALELASAEDRRTAVLDVVSRWSASDPAAAVEHTNQLDSPLADIRRSALDVALSQWIRQDLAAAAAWIDRQRPDRQLDGPVIDVATSPALATYRPLVAVNWAESVFDPQLRSHALATVLQTWLTRDRASAAAYLAQSKDVNPIDRGIVLAALENTTAEQTR